MTYAGNNVDSCDQQHNDMTEKRHDVFVGILTSFLLYISQVPHGDLLSVIRLAWVASSRSDALVSYPVKVWGLQCLVSAVTPQLLPHTRVELFSKRLEGAGESSWWELLRVLQSNNLCKHCCTHVVLCLGLTPPQWASSITFITVNIHHVNTSTHCSIMISQRSGFHLCNHSSCSYWILTDLLLMYFQWKWWRTKSTVCPRSHLKVDVKPAWGLSSLS